MIVNSPQRTVSYCPFYPLNLSPTPSRLAARRRRLYRVLLNKTEDARQTQSLIAGRGVSPRHRRAAQYKVYMPMGGPVYI